MAAPSFYAVIPATVRYCKELEPNAKLLYGEITALAQREGFCWASNQYFADLYEVDDRTVRRWLLSLKEKGFIEIELEKIGIQSTRKIWISREVQKYFTKGQNCPGGGKKMSGGEDKNVHHSNTSNITSEEDVCIDPPVGDQISKEQARAQEKERILKAAEKGSNLPSSVKKQHPDGSWQEIRLQSIFEASVRKRKDWSTDEIHDAWKILIDQNELIRDPLRYLEGIITKLRNFKKSEYLDGQKGQWKSKKKNSESENYNENSSENDTEELVSLGSLLAERERERSLHGLSEGKIS